MTQRMFRPGEPAPEEGIYQCDCGRGHRWTAPAPGRPLPTMPTGCTGGAWRLAKRLS
jgi:hypothetical protein